MSGHSHWATIKHKKGAIDARRGKLFSKLSSAGNVAYLFDRRGVFTVDAKSQDEDTLMGIALEAGADDMRRDGSKFLVICDPAHFGAVQAALHKAAVKAENEEITQLPKA